METSGWEVTLAVATILLAMATAALVIVGGWAAKAGALAARAALQELRDTREAVRIAQDQLTTSRRIAAKDTERRRAEKTLAAVRRFMDTHMREYDAMLQAARTITRERELAADGKAFKRYSVKELFTLEDDHVPPDDAVHALKRILDVMEEIAVGVRLHVYDVNIVYHVARSRMRLTFDQGRKFIEDVRLGQASNHQVQASAWEHLEILVTEDFPAIEKAGAPTKLAGALDE